MLSQGQRGLTLVELMVALIISAMLVVGASMLYLNTRLSQRSSDDGAQLAETGRMALEIIGGQIANAGFYPMISEEPGASTGASTLAALSGYAEAIKVVAGATPPVAIATGLHGCSGGVENADYSGCTANTTGDAPGSDSVTVAYFTDDALSLDVGWRADCTRADIANDVVHNTADRIGSYIKAGATSSTSRATSSEGLPPALPLLGINQFLLVPMTYVDDAQSAITTYALACRGNGNRSSSTGGASTPKTLELVPGVIQMTLIYGVVTDSSGVPGTYLSATQVDSLAGDVVVGNQKLSGWGRVVTVRACVMVRSLNHTALNTGATLRPVNDCSGTEVTPPTGVAYKTFSQVFGVKNRIQQTISTPL